MAVLAKTPTVVRMLKDDHKKVIKEEEGEMFPQASDAER